MQNPLATLASKLRGPSPTEKLRAAEAALEQTRKDAPQAQYRAMSNAAVNPLGDWHPTFDTAALLVADAELELAKAQSAFAAADPEATALRASMRAALESALSRLDALVDPVEPTIASTPEAQALYDQDVKGYEHGRKHNQQERSACESAAVKALAKASSSSETREVLAKLDAALAAIVDPPEATPGRVCPETVAGLERAMSERAEAIRANAAQRSEVLDRFQTVAKAIFAARDDLARKRKAEGLPGASLFAPPYPGASIGRQYLLTGGCDVLRTHLEALGCAPVEARQAKQTRLDINARRRAYEQRPRHAQQLRSQALPSARRL